MCAKSPRTVRLLLRSQANGPLTFARFMELALYDPVGGYYASARPGLANSGDFFTNVSVGPVFGRDPRRSISRNVVLDLANRHALPWLSRGRTTGNSPWIFSERWRSEILETAEYWIIEPFQPCGDFKSRSSTDVEGKVKWVDDLSTLPVFDGIHFSNELVDSFPFHLDPFEWHRVGRALRLNRCRTGSSFEVACPSTVIADALQSLCPRAPRGQSPSFAPRPATGFTLLRDA